MLAPALELARGASHNRETPMTVLTQARDDTLSQIELIKNLMLASSSLVLVAPSSVVDVGRELTESATKVLGHYSTEHLSEHTYNMDHFAHVARSSIGVGNEKDDKRTRSGVPSRSQ